MSKIQTFLDNILSARFGKDVRQSIHDAIQEIDSVADTAKDSATAQAEAARKSALSASENASAAAVSEDNAKTYMQYANASATNAKASEEASKLSETSSKSSETNAKLSEEKAQAVFESLPEDYGTLSKEFYEVAIKQKASGEDIHVNDSSNAKVREFALFGKARQQTTSGKNKLNLETSSQGLLNYVDGILASSNTTWLTSDFIEVNNQNISIYSNNASDNFTVRLCEYNSLREFIKCTTNMTGVFGNETKSLVLDSKTKYIRISYGFNNRTTTKESYIASGNVIQVEEGTEVTPYEPYTGGQPSPSPDYPQEIEVPNGDVVVKSCGKNKFNIYDKTKDFHPNAVIDKDGYVNVSLNNANGTTVAYANFWTNTSANVKPNKRYKIICDNQSSNCALQVVSTNVKNKSQFINNLTAPQGISTNIITTTYDFSACTNMLRTFTEVPPGKNAIVKFRIMIVEENETDVNYEPYKETTGTIPVTDFAGISVASGGNYTDSNGQQWIANEIRKYADGSGEDIQRICKAVFDGSSDEGWSINPLGEIMQFYTPQITEAKSSNLVLNTHFTSSNLLVENNNSFISASGRLNCVTNLYSTLDEWKSHLAENPMTVYYELAEPIRTPLTAEEVAEIEKLCTFYPVTNITNDGDCGMKVTYLADSKLYIDNRLAQIEAALVNNI